MYSKERAQQITKNDIKYIAAGIQENVTLKGARVAKSPQGNSYIELTFEKDGATIIHTEWKPTKFSGMSDEDLQKKEDNQFSRFMQILLCFYKDEDLTFDSDNFEGWAKEVVNYLEKADKSTLLRVKFVYNDKGYITLPKYAKYTFIEPMSVSKEDSVIVELGIDNFTRPVIADKETDSNNIADNDLDDDLPF